jgi:hypothetical protein
MAVSDDLGRYRTISTLGSGGMATVELAEDELLGRQVALKRLRTELVDGVSRLRREALLGASISHPNVVAVYDVLSSEDGGLVIVMEYVPGETLGQKLSREGRLAPGEACRILAAIAAALDAIHQRGIVHRDIKPANILLGEGSAVKLADLGIASVQDRTRITSAGTMLGSLRYMAPEQLSDASVTPAIDTYALSAVAFEALSGRPARREPNAMALAHAIATLPPPDLDEVWPAAPRRATEALKRGMALDPAERQASAGEFVRQLQVAFEPTKREPPTTARVVPPVVRSQARQQPSRVRPLPAVAPAAGRTELGRGQRPARTRDGSPRRRGRAGIAAALLLLGAGLAGLTVLLSASSDGTSKARGASAAVHRRTTHRSSSAAAAAVVSGTSSAAAATSSAASTTPAPPATSAASPTSAVQAFYELAAAHRYSQAWALADPALRGQLGSFASFEAGQAGDRSITFSSLRTVSQSAGAATVSLSTTSVRTDGTHHCRGSADLLSRPPDGWVVHQIHITCS